MNPEELLGELHNLCTSCPESIKPLELTWCRQNEKSEALQAAFSEGLTPERQEPFERWLSACDDSRNTLMLLEFASGLELGARLARMLG